MADERVRLRTLGLTLGLCLAVSGCVVAAGPRGYYYRGGFIAVAPPAPLIESYGPAPYPGYVWLGGYWRWNGARYLWMRGHWAPPHPGYRWAPAHWVRRPRGWRFLRGHWVPR